MREPIKIMRFDDMGERQNKNILKRIPWGYKIVAGVVLLAVILIVVLINVLKPKSEFIQYSMSEEASANTLIWLNHITDNELDFATVLECMGDMSVTVERIPGKKGAYTQILVEDTYDACLAQATEGFKKAYIKAIENRILEQNPDAELEEDTVDNLMSDVYGVSVDEYLSSVECEIIPDIDAVKERYNMEVTNEE